MSYQMVERDGINHIFPETIPKKRNNRDVIAKIIASSIALGVGCYSTIENKLNYLVYINTYNYLFLISIEIIKRVCHLYEEIYHINSRYDKKTWILFRELFSFNKYNAIILPAALVTIAFATDGPLHSITKHGIPACLFSFVGVQLISEIIKLEENGIQTALLIEKLKGLDYGSGMAHSFYHGYLKLILPCTENSKGCIKNTIDIYESTHNVKFATKKLYMLMPVSAHCPDKLNDISNKIEEGHKCETIILNKAGVIHRVYKNTVYKLLPGNNEVIYAMAEYATPLLTLHKVISHNTDESRYYKKYLKEIVTNFYTTLDRIIREDRTCRDYCHLIYYRDIDENGESLPIDICDLLVKRIQYDQKNAYP